MSPVRSPSPRAIWFAVPGMICIKPEAAAPERALGWNRLSWRMIPYAHAGSMPTLRLYDMTLF